MFAQHVQNITITGGGDPPWVLLLWALFCIVACIGAVRFIYRTKKRNREFDPLRKTVEEQQKKIDELKRELETLNVPHATPLPEGKGTIDQ